MREKGDSHCGFRDSGIYDFLVCICSMHEDTKKFSGERFTNQEPRRTDAQRQAFPLIDRDGAVQRAEVDVARCGALCAMDSAVLWKTPWKNSSAAVRKRAVDSVTKLSREALAAGIFFF